MEPAKIVIGILGVMLILSSGAYLLKGTGSNKSCSTGCVFQESGEFEGRYGCFTTTSKRYEYCASVWDTATGKKAYWCAQAVPVLVEESGVPVIARAPGEVPQYACSPPPDGCKLV